MKKKLVFYTLTAFCLLIVSTPAHSQLKEKAGEILNAIVTSPEKVDTSTIITSISPEEKAREDSLKLDELALQIQEMKLNEILLLSELENTKNSHSIADSIKKEEQRQRIDSLRTLTAGVPVIINNDTLFTLYAQKGGLTPHSRAEGISNVLLQIGKDYSFTTDSVYVLESEHFSDVMYGDRVIFSVTDQDAIWQNTTREELALKYVPLVSEKITELKKEYNILAVVKRVLLFAFILIVQYILFRLTNLLFRKIQRKVIWLTQNKLKSISIKDYEFLNTHKQGRILLFCTRILKYLVLLIQLAFTIPILFAIFPQTEDIALKLFSYVIDPIKMIFKSIITYIPNLFIIIIIYYAIRYLIRGIQYIAKEIEDENLKISGFFPDWAQPTFNIIKFLLYAFMIALIYPYLPGANSGVFQGISVFVGLIVSLGSSSVIGNIIAGLVITYMRPFKLGDRIKLNETVGNVIEKTPLVTRIRTPKNEIVTIPNSFVMSSHTTNFSSSAQNYGLIIHTTVSIGYEVPWRITHEILINAAKATPGVLSHPEPFVLGTELHDYYPVYQINAYIKDADKLAKIYSDLHQNIQDKFNEAKIEILSPHYYAYRDGNTSTIPPEYMNKSEK